MSSSTFSKVKRFFLIADSCIPGQIEANPEWEIQNWLEYTPTTPCDCWEFCAGDRTNAGSAAPKRTHGRQKLEALPAMQGLPLPER